MLAHELQVSGKLDLTVDDLFAAVSATHRRIEGAYAVIAGHPFTFEASTGYIVSLVYLSVFGSIIAFGAYLTLLGRIGAHKAGYAVVMFPVVALILSTLFEGLRIDLTIVAGTLLVLAGNVFVLKGTEVKSLRQGRVNLKDS